MHAGYLLLGASFFSYLDIKLLLGHIDYLFIQISAQASLIKFLFQTGNLFFVRLGIMNLLFL